MELEALHTALATTIILAWFAILVGWLATFRPDERNRMLRQAHAG
jgi:hypothetical protein